MTGLVSGIKLPNTKQVLVMFQQINQI